MFEYEHICVRNHVKLGVSLRVLYCVVDTGYGFSFPLKFDAGRPVNTNGVWPNFLFWSPPWLYASSVKNKTLKPGKLVDNEIIVSQFLRYFS